MKKGITLLEIMIVIAIIAILASIIIFALRPTQILQDTKTSKRESDKLDIRSGLDSYVSEHMIFPTSIQSLQAGIYDICKQGTGSGCTSTGVSIDELVTTGYLSKVPVDTGCEGATDTCYDLVYNPFLNEADIIALEDEIPFSVPVTLPPIVDAENSTVVLNGTADADSMGHAVTNLGDINDDNIDDIAVSSPNAVHSGFPRGSVYIVYGKTNFTSSINIEDADVIIAGIENSAYFGGSVGGGGDFNDDGINDLIVAAPSSDPGGNDSAGSVFIFFGSDSLASSMTASQADIRINGIEDADNLGINVSEAGDFNNDGVDDFILGAMNAGNLDNGAAYLFFGDESLSGTINASSANVTFTGQDFFNLGYDVAGIGKFNNDDFDDVVIGAVRYNNYTGKALVFYGSANPAATINSTLANVSINGTDVNDFLGYTVAGVGDVNNDNYDDIVLGSYAAKDQLSVATGRGYIVFGGADVSSNINAASSNVVINGVNNGDRFGIDVSSAGDINNDYYDDVLIGAYEATDAGSFRGRAFVVYGAASMSATINAENSNIIFNGTNNNDRLGTAVSDLGDINHDGFADIIIAAKEASDTGSFRGRAYVYMPSRD